MATVTVVGSGPSGVHFAEALLEEGHRVRLLDVGSTGPDAVEPDASLEELKSTLTDPAEYFLGERLQGVVQPDDASEYYGLPPSKDFVLRGPEREPLRLAGFAPLFSWARGGLAEAWTGGCYPFNPAELKDFPFDAAELELFYDEVAAAIGIGGGTDDLAPFVPVHRHLQEPLELDAHSRLLAERYSASRSYLNGRLGLHLGRSRVAVLSRRHGDREPCAYLGRCLWGCPRRSLYTPSLTLERLVGRSGFDYLPGRLVRRFEVDADGRVRRVVWTDPAGQEETSEPVEILALAAGTLASARIFLESWPAARGAPPRLEGLMDNRQVMVPFLTFSRIGKAYEPDSYQYNQLAIGLEMPSTEEYVHCLVTTLKTALAHPIIQSVPLDLKTATWIFRNVRAALGLVNVNFHDRRRPGCFVQLGSGDPGRPPLTIEYVPPKDEPERVRLALRRLGRGLRRLGAVVPPGMTRWRPMGASVHYAGTLPMTRSGGSLTTDPNCRSRDFPNLYVVDGSTFPFLPAKNLTFTLMANARRVARRAFAGGTVRD